MLWWMKQKRNPEKDLKSLTAALQAAIGNQLKSVVVFGSLAREEFDPQRSNVNVLVIAELPIDNLRRMDSALKPWVAKGHLPPVMAEPDELPALARDFPIEFLDMREQHRVIYGEDPLAALKVDRHHLQAECTHDLALNRLRLRQAIASAGSDKARIRNILIASLSSTLTLLRASLRIDGDGEKLDKMKAAQEWSKRVGFDSSVFQHIKDAGSDAHQVAAVYLEAIDKVLNYLRK
jgi:predicted nucleotidyltransferase